MRAMTIPQKSLNWFELLSRISKRFKRLCSRNRRKNSRRKTSVKELLLKPFRTGKPKECVKQNKGAKITFKLSKPRLLSWHRIAKVWIHGKESSRIVIWTRHWAQEVTICPAWNLQWSIAKQTSLRKKVRVVTGQRAARLPHSTSDTKGKQKQR